MTTPRLALLVPFSLGILIGTIAGPRATASSEQTEAEIRGIMERLRLASFLSDQQSKTERAADLATLEQLLSDDYVRLTAEGTFLSKTEVLEAYGPAPNVSSVRYERLQVFLFEGGTAIAVCSANFDASPAIKPWNIARVFTKQGTTWRLIGELAGSPTLPLLSESVELPAIAPRNPALPRNDRAEVEVRAALERYRVAMDPESQRAFGRSIDRTTVLATWSTDFVGLDINLNGGDRRGGRRAQLIADMDRKDATDKRHEWMNQPGASLTFENINVAVIGSTAIVSRRVLSHRSSRRLPKAGGISVWEKRGQTWLWIFTLARDPN